MRRSLFGLGLAVLLGADIGSTLVVQAMSFDPRPLIPALLALHGALVLAAVDGRDCASCHTSYDLTSGCNDDEHVK